MGERGSAATARKELSVRRSVKAMVTEVANLSWGDSCRQKASLGHLEAEFASCSGNTWLVQGKVVGNCTTMYV